MTVPVPAGAGGVDREARRAALDVYFAQATGRAGSGLADYIQRLRQAHSAVVSGGTYRGCACGEIMCGKDLLLAWADELIASYEAKVQDFAAETRRTSELAAALAAAEQRADTARDEALAAIARIPRRVGTAEWDKARDIGQATGFDVGLARAEQAVRAALSSRPVPPEGKQR